MGYIAEIPTRVSGIPCRIGVISYDYQAPDHGTWASDQDYYGWEDCDWDLLDRKGYRAKWLEKKLTDKEGEEIAEKIYAYMRGEAEASKTDAAIDRYLDHRGY